MRVLVTGGAGFIGSHTCKALAQAGLEPVTYDSLVTGHRSSVKWGPFEQGDVRDQQRLTCVIRNYRPEACIHFAAAAYVGESIDEPEKYYSNNVVGTLSLLAAMRYCSVDTIVFSSTCATYGIPKNLPITEASNQSPINPYGSSKLVAEWALKHYHQAYGLRYAVLRYFNACGADPDDELREDHNPETHLIPRCLMAAIGMIPRLDIYGADYATPDGTCVRDYVHVSDLASGHLLALQNITAKNAPVSFNLGAGQGYSILEIIDGIESVLGLTVPYVVRERRRGDPPELVADISAAKATLGYDPKWSDLPTILRTAWQKFEAVRRV